VALGWFKRIYCTYRHVQRLARVDGGRRGAVVVTSMPQLVRGLAAGLDWECSEDRFADRDRHHTSVRRWLDALQAAGLIRWRAAENDEGELCRTEITLLPVPELDAHELAAAEARWEVWRRRYGPSLKTAAQRCLGDVFARVRPPAPAQWRGLARRRGRAIQAARERISTVLAPPSGALPNGRENPLHSAHTKNRARTLAAGTGARASRGATGTSDGAMQRAIASPGSEKRETPGTEEAAVNSARTPQGHATAGGDPRAEAASPRRPLPSGPAASDPLLDRAAIATRVAARTTASAWRRMHVARQARKRARELLTATPGARHGLARLREAWVVWRFGTEIRANFTSPASGAERVGDHGHADAGPRTAGQLERARSAIGNYERHAECRPAGWPVSGAGALCALAAQRRADTLDGDIARLACLARAMHATARDRDSGRLERLRRRAQRRMAVVRQARLPFSYLRPEGPRVETAEQRRQRVRDELLLAAHDPGSWPNSALAIASIYSPATAGPDLVGWDGHAELDGAAARARRYALEQQRGHWSPPDGLRAVTELSRAANPSCLGPSTRTSPSCHATPTATTSRPASRH
jgi:hypothetical protein